MGGSASVELDNVKSKGIIEKKDLPFPKVGVKLCVFEEAINGCGGRDALRGLTTTDVCNKFLKPATSKYQNSFCEFRGF